MKFKSFSAHILALLGLSEWSQGRGQKLYHGRGSGKTEKLRFYRKIPHGL